MVDGTWGILKDNLAGAGQVLDCLFPHVADLGFIGSQTKPPPSNRALMIKIWRYFGAGLDVVGWSWYFSRDPHAGL